MEHSEEQVLAELLRQSGLAARYLTGGAAGLGAAFANPLALGMNKLNESMGSDLRFPDQYAAIQSALTELGLPEPEGTVEEAIGFASELGVPDPSDSAKVVAGLSHLIDPSMAIVGVGTGGKAFSGNPSQEAEALARELRAAEQGYDLEGLHGSTHDIQRFSTERSEPGSDWGKSTYISTSPEDVSHNYAGMGPDLSARISKRSEELAEDLYNTPKDEFEDQWGVPYETYIEDEAGIADMLARQELKGQNEGVIYPLRVRGKDLVHVGGDNDTFLPMSERNYYEEAKADLDPKDYASEDEFQDEVMEYMQQLQADDADNLIGKLYDALQQSDLANDTDSIVNIMERATQDAYDGDGLFASRLNHLIRSGVESGLVLDDDGNIIPAGAIAAQVFEHLGFKGAVDNTVYDKFGQRRGPWGKPITGMAGVEPDTAHIIVFPGHENIIRSRFAKFDPDKMSSTDILAGVGGAAVAPALLSNTLREQENEKWKKQ